MIQFMQNKFFPEIKEKFGFGFMRLPLGPDKEVDDSMVCEMLDRFLEAGFNYVDTAHGYLGGASERGIRRCLTSRHSRDEYILTDKLTQSFFNSREEIEPLLRSQLEICGVVYFDFYLMHAQKRGTYEHFMKCHAYEEAFRLKELGLVHHVGISFHDKASFLDEILTAWPQIEVVQIQFNYADYDDLGIESRKCYEVCVKHGKPVIVMEPVKGGFLANLPEYASKVFDRIGRTGSDASYALRFAAQPENIMMVLSGMSTREQVSENLALMKNPAKLNEAEMGAIAQINELLHRQDMVACTGCRYCVDGCPAGIPIPEIFADMNSRKIYHDWNSSWYYTIHTEGKGLASECLKCGACESTCPQHLPIRELLVQAADVFETKRKHK